jgi:glycine dehydrogenase
MITNNFILRHNGPRPEEVLKMLEKIGVSSLDELIDITVPEAIRAKRPLGLSRGMNEYQYLRHLKEIASKNKIYKSFIGLGYYNTITPGVIQRNILENPGWYTSYTPYQAEISQGRLEALLVFQTMVSDMTGMPMSNCSLLDEGTAAAEAMIMAFNARPRGSVKRDASRFFVSNDIFPQTLDVVIGRSKPLGIEVVTGDHEKVIMDDSFFGALVQYPAERGQIYDYQPFAGKVHSAGALLCVAADLMSLALLRPPAEWGADIVAGSSQRFGIPMGYGGPHAAFLATTDEYKRHMPGRIIGVSVDAKGNRALRMALQTREQHIKRERATSNICTAQALLATMAGMYAVYHGKDGIYDIARHINILAGVLAQEVVRYGYRQCNESFFDTVELEIPAGVSMDSIRSLALEQKMNFRYLDDRRLGISVDETTELADINLILNILAKANRILFTTFICHPKECEKIRTFPQDLERKSEFLTHPVFSSYHSETDMMRYLKMLENKDLALNRTMIPLGSCTMKLNAAAEMFFMSWSEFAEIHPFVPQDQAEGYSVLIREMEKIFCEITGFAAMSFQPNSGAAGEYAGMMVIQAYHRANGQGHRNVCLIPSSAHGTNPASAHMAGMEIAVVKCDAMGNIDLNDLREKAVAHRTNLSAIMVTYPSTHGVFEEGILELVRIVHENGGQVYMDGANMNAQVGLTSPGQIGADVCHLNLHKTFAIPHGGGGPGAGPIGVAAHLAEFLPSNPISPTGGNNPIHAVASAPFGSAFILPISYGYVKMLGVEGLTLATKYAILNANYLLACLKDHYKILYTGKNGTCAHEMILDCNEFHRTAGVEVISIAKRLMDYGFHAPTVAFPVHGTLMVEPTESEPLRELDRFVGAMIEIRKEIQEIVDGKADPANNVLKNAPHTAAMVMSSRWEYPYSREKAVTASPLETKYWPPVTRIDDAYGDRNLMCTCEF